MPWATPTLKEVRALTRDYVLTQLGAKAMIPNSVLRIMSDSMAGLSHLVLLYIDWLSKQQLPDTAETEWLDRHGQIWLVNADGSKGRKAATFASGEVVFTGVTGTIVPVGTLLSAAGGVQYQTTTEAIIGDSGGTATAVALTAGTVGNMADGQGLALTSAIDGIDGTATLYGDMTGGVDTETDDQLRERILRRIQQPPMGGAQYDYEAWALAVPGVTRAWAAPEQGTGTITVRFLMDDLRASDDGWPTPQDIDTVSAYIDSKRPVTVKDCYVLAPIKQFIDITIASLTPDTTNTRGAIELAVRDMLFTKAAPGQTIYTSWVNYAIMSANGVQSFNLLTTADYVMPSLGHMAVLETILYE
jgi:uncharacterized phage protein gp47/JayE